MYKLHILQVEEMFISETFFYQNEKVKLKPLLQKYIMENRKYTCMEKYVKYLIWKISLRFSSTFMYMVFIFLDVMMNKENSQREI